MVELAATIIGVFPIRAQFGFIASILEGSTEMSSSSRIALFIDGANLYATAKALGFDIDYKRACSRISRPVGRWCAPSTTPQLSRIRNIRRSVPSSIGSTTTVTPW